MIGLWGPELALQTCYLKLDFLCTCWKFCFPFKMLNTQFIEIYNRIYCFPISNLELSVLTLIYNKTGTLRAFCDVTSLFRDLLHLLHMMIPVCSASLFCCSTLQSERWLSTGSKLTSLSRAWSQKGTSRLHCPGHDWWSIGQDRLRQVQRSTES